MDKEDEKYKQDKRTPCKYGQQCYQQNPAHHERYKHPPKRESKKLAEHSVKKFKAEDKVITTKHGSDSDDYSIEDDSDSNSEKHTKETNKKVNNDVSDSDNESSESNPSDAEEDSKKEDTSAGTVELSPTVDDKKTDKLDSKEINTEGNSPDEVKNEDSENKVITLSSTEEDWSKFIKDKFLVTMPKDFYQFWTFCEKLKPKNALEAFKEVGLYLVGPFDVLAGKFSGVTKKESEYLIHWRYYRDPPELQTVLRSDDPSGYHIGYLRDSPECLPVLLVSNASKKDGILTAMGGNIFSAVNLFLEDLKKSGNPFKKLAIGKLQTSLLKEAEKLKIDLSRKTKAMIAREKKIVTRTFNKIGLCVPYDKKAQLGYRELAQTNKELEANLTKFSKANSQEEKARCLTLLQPVFTYTSIATDECDFGTGIELGWNIISHGVDSLNATIERFLVVNYNLLNMEAFAKIAEAHMKNRKQGINLSIL